MAHSSGAQTRVHNLTQTLFLSATDLTRLVQRKGVRACLRGIAQRIESDFLRWHEFDKCARVAHHHREGVMELMPIANDEHYAFKYVNGHPRNTRHGLPTVMAFGALADVASGTPRLLSELTLTTALRTAAMSAVAAKALARAPADVMALIGNGAQSEFQALAFQEINGVQELQLFDTDPAATAKLVRNLQTSGLKLTVCASAAEAARGAHIVTTVTADKARATIVTPDMIEPGMHLNAVGGDCPGKTELHADVLRQARVFVEYEPQTRVEGDIQQLPADFAVTELWQVLAGTSQGRLHEKDVTVFDSVGFALEDFSALCFLQEAVLEAGLGTWVQLVPQAGYPKDLFGALGETEVVPHEATAGC